MVDRLRTIDPQEKPIVFSIDIFAKKEDKEAKSQFMVNGAVGFWISDIRANRVSLGIVCDSSIQIEKGSQVHPRDDIQIQKEGISALILHLRPAGESNVFVGDDLELCVDEIVERGVYMTVRSPKILFVQTVDSSKNLREILQSRGVSGNEK